MRHRPHSAPPRLDL
ncbi:hypothetical protein C360_05793 [Cryptococcus neoformans Bt15]|nr:hypothetical protein C360_05793 [Cryptococcus neoformans var. grubii Bt15]